MRALRRHFALLIAATIAAAFVSAPAVAQDSTTLTESQLEYNNQGVTLINKGNYDEALGNFQSSLAIGEANVTYLNLGRTYTRMERCADAAAAFQKAETAPAVASPSREEVAAVLERYRSELDEICSSRLKLQCGSKDLTVRINEAPEIACPDTPVPITPGEHVVIASSGETSQEYSVNAVAGEVVTVDVSVPDGSADREPESTSANPMRSVAWTSTIGSGVLLATGLILDQTVVATRYDELEAASRAGDRAVYDARLQDYRSIRNVNRVIFAAGGVAAASSIVFWILSSSSESASNPGVAFVPRRDGVTFQIGWRL